jgi:hypothetical protein
MPNWGCPSALGSATTGTTFLKRPDKNLKKRKKKKEEEKKKIHYTQFSA